MIGAIIAKSKVRSAFASLNRHDLIGFLSGWAEDAIFFYPGNISASGKMEGKKAIQEWFRKYLDQFPTLNFTLKYVRVQNIFAFGGTNVVAVEWDLNLTNREGKDFQNSGVTVINIKKGRVTSVRDYMFDIEVLKKAWGEEKEHSSIKPPIPLERDEMWLQLQNASSLRSSEDQVVWNIFGIFWAANILLLIALFQSGKFPSEPIIGIIVSLVGIVLSRVWDIIQYRGLGHLERYEKLMQTLEKQLITEGESKFAISSRINVDDYNLCLPIGKSARHVMKRCSEWSIFPWIFFILFFILYLIWTILHCKYNLI